MIDRLRWKRHRKLVISLTAGLLILVLGFGNTRVSAITSSERHTTDAFISTDIKGFVALFDDSRTHTIALQFTQADYDRLIAAYQTEGEKAYIEASITIDGTTINPVGLRLKGNSTLRGLGGRGGMAGGMGGGMGSTVSASDPTTLPWLVSFDEYVKGQRYQGYTDIAIRPVLSSQTMLNEALALNLMAEAGQPSQQNAYSSFVVNDSAPDLRLVVEIPSENYANENFPHDGVLYKALSTGKFTYLGDDPLAYKDAFKQITRKKQQDLKPLISLLQWVSTASDEEFAANLDRYIDVDSLANYVALQSHLNNFDDMSGPGQNYYLWYDLETGKFSVLAWDLNLAFGQGMGGGMGGGGAVGAGGQGAAGQRQNGQPPPGGGQPPVGGAPPGGQPPVGGAPPGGTQPGGQAGGNAGQAQPANGFGAGGFGGRGGNRLKERFVAAAAFKDRYNQAYAQIGQTLYGSGAATAELDRLAAVIKASKLLPDATLEAEVTTLRAALATRKAATTP